MNKKLLGLILWVFGLPLVLAHEGEEITGTESHTLLEQISTNPILIAVVLITIIVIIMLIYWLIRKKK